MKEGAFITFLAIIKRDLRLFVFKENWSFDYLGMKRLILLILILSFFKCQFRNNFNGFISGRIFQLGGKCISHKVGVCVTTKFSVLAENYLLAAIS